MCETGSHGGARGRATPPLQVPYPVRSAKPVTPPPEAQRVTGSDHNSVLCSVFFCWGVHDYASLNSTCWDA